MVEVEVSQDCTGVLGFGHAGRLTIRESLITEAEEEE